ncbi:DUF4920 domain-containing protein [Algibacter sp.]|jgi:hypothetical protein|uniref:DUF4920 domain-containing protein n=1 Tax=uncultured Algibacter sp. TaxID=298659 RepID=UPI00233D6B74|nr:DUF4920 domain-containing protein [uncultured Algibacter sp.]MDB4402209.1 DUF4920 domain-containing protein [Algibacter sp.]
MKSITLAIICILMLNSCKNKSQDAVVNPVKVEKIEYASFGKEIIADDAVSASSMAAHYKIMKAGDSINSKIIAEVHEVCQAKGCWMRLNLDDENEVMVKFKDYGFFVPKDITGKKVIINGQAFVEEVSIDEQRHYAEDAGKSAEEIASITVPKRTYSFEADGVLVVK